MRSTLRDILLVAATLAALALMVHLQTRWVEPRRETLLNLCSPLPLALLHATNFNSSLAAGDRPWAVMGERRMAFSDIPSRVAAISMAGIRGFLSTYLWIQAESEKNRDIHEDLLDNYYRIASLQPDYPSVWEFNGWNMAWNVSVQWPSVERRYEWIRHGINYLLEGLRRNPNSLEIMDRLAAVYYWRIDQNNNPEDREYFSKRVEEDEGASPMLLAYKWYDRMRRVQAETGEAHPLFSRKVVSTQACYAAHGYAKELTRKALEELAGAAELQVKGQAAEARRACAAAHKDLAYAYEWWNTAASEWAKQRERFPDDTNAPIFGGGAATCTAVVARLLTDLTPENLARDPKSFQTLVKSAQSEDLLLRRMIWSQDPEAYATP